MINFSNNGYHLVEGLFDVSSIKQEIDSIFGTKTDREYMELFDSNRSKFVSFATASQRLISVLELSSSQKMQSALSEIGIRTPAVNTRPLISYSHPNTASNSAHWKIPAHQDWPSTLGSLNGVTCWVPLVDVNESMGALQIMPGSHLEGTKLMKHVDGVPVVDWSDFDDSKFETIEMKAGDALFFSYFTIHRSGNNVSDKIRFSMHFRYDDLQDEDYISRDLVWNRKDSRTEASNRHQVTKQEVTNAFRHSAD
jgi:phytanoyl-CoA hydroxylase